MGQVEAEAKRPRRSSRGSAYPRWVKLRVDKECRSGGRTMTTGQ